MKRKLLITPAILAVLAIGWFFWDRYQKQQYAWLRTLKFPSYMKVTYAQETWDGRILGGCVAIYTGCPVNRNAAHLSFDSSLRTTDVLDAVTAKLASQNVSKISQGNDVEPEYDPQHPGKLVSYSDYRVFYRVPGNIPGCAFLQLDTAFAPTARLNDPTYWDTKTAFMAIGCIPDFPSNPYPTPAPPQASP